MELNSFRELVKTAKARIKTGKDQQLLQVLIKYGCDSPEAENAINTMVACAFMQKIKALAKQHFQQKKVDNDKNKKESQEKEFKNEIQIVNSNTSEEWYKEQKQQNRNINYIQDKSSLANCQQRSKLNEQIIKKFNNYKAGLENAIKNNQSTKDTIIQNEAAWMKGLSEKMHASSQQTQQFLKDYERKQKEAVIAQQSEETTRQEANATKEIEDNKRRKQDEELKKKEEETYMQQKAIEAQQKETERQKWQEDKMKREEKMKALQARINAVKQQAQQRADKKYNTF